MSAYRFCRTDDVALLVDALNRCWSPYFPDEPPMTPEVFKRSIRDLQVWCSSCMVAFSGSDPIGVLIGAKRPSGTLIHKIAVHPPVPESPPRGNRDGVTGYARFPGRGRASTLRSEGAVRLGRLREWLTYCSAATRAGAAFRLGFISSAARRL